MSYQFYNILHLSSILALGMILAALWGIYSSSPQKKSTGQKSQKKSPLRSLLLSLHGIIMILIFVAGFALIAKKPLPFPWPFWIYIKMLIWLLLAIAPLLIKKSRKIFSGSKYIIVLLACFLIMFLALLLVKLN